MFNSLVFEPVQLIKKNFYRCDSRFYIDEIIDMYDDSLEHRIDGIVYVDGSICQIFFAQDGRAKLIHKIDIRLISQFKNGGQSSNRLERIVDENREMFVEKVVNKTIKTFYDKDHNSTNISNLVIFGPSRFKNDVVNHKKNILSKYFKSVHTLTSSGAELGQVLEYLDTIIDPEEIKTIDELQEYIDLTDERLVFGDDIHTLILEYTVGRLIIAEYTYEKFMEKLGVSLDYGLEITILRSDRAHDWIEVYGGAIGIKWY